MLRQPRISVQLAVPLVAALVSLVPVVSAAQVGAPPATWTSVSIGDVGKPGSAAQNNGVWTLTGSGRDIWGTDDSFQYLYRNNGTEAGHLIVRIDDIQNTNAFAKAGLMMRASLDADAPAIILDVRPGGYVEWMARSGTEGEMSYLGGTQVTLPVWLQLSWDTRGGTVANVVGSVSQDHVNWTAVGPAVPFELPRTYNVGVAVTSHDQAQLTTVHADGLSLLPSSWWTDDVGYSRWAGNATMASSSDNFAITAQGAGGDIWGTADSFQFVHDGPITSAHYAVIYRIVSVDNTSAFAKGGVMIRDGLATGAASVVLDAKPDGNVEFMARLCAGCATTYVGGASLTFPFYLSLTRDGAVFTAAIYKQDPTSAIAVGSVNVPMDRPFPGFAVTSHDPNRMTTAVFDNPAR